MMLCAATEMSLTIYTLPTFNLTKEAVQEFKKDPSLEDIDDEGLAGWVDGTFARHNVLLKLTKFFPEMMNLDVKNAFLGKLQNNGFSGMDLQMQRGHMTAMREWFFHPTEAIAPDYAFVSEEALRLHGTKDKGHWLQSPNHLIKFLQAMAKSNVDLLNQLMEGVPKDIAGALGIEQAPITRGAGDSQQPKDKSKGKRKATDDTIQPTSKEPKNGSTSGAGAVALVLSSDTESDEEVDLTATRLPWVMSVASVTAQSPKITMLPVKEHQPIRWDSHFSYTTCTEKQHAEIEALLATRCLSEGMGIVMNTQALSPPAVEIAVRELVKEHVEGECTAQLQRTKGATSHMMFGLLLDDSFKTSEHLTMAGPNQTQLRLLQSYKRATIQKIQNKNNLPNGYEVQMLGGNHTMHAKKRMMAMTEYQDWTGLQTMTLHIWVNLPICFSRYLGWKHNSMSESQLETYPVLSLRKARTAWEKKLVDLTGDGGLPSHIVENGYVGVDCMGIKEYNKQLKERKEDQIWTDANNREWRINNVGPAFGIAPTKEQYAARKDLDAFGNYAQRSAQVWESFSRLEQAINRYTLRLLPAPRVILPAPWGILLLNLLQRTCTHLFANLRLHVLAMWFACLDALCCC